MSSSHNQQQHNQQQQQKVTTPATPATITDVDPNKDNPLLRILRKGDLVRVTSESRYRTSKTKNRINGLGRIIKSIPIISSNNNNNQNNNNNNESSLLDEQRTFIYNKASINDDMDFLSSLSKHPYKYDVNWILGGKSHNILRCELIHTTATSEGFTITEDTEDTDNADASSNIMRSRPSRKRKKPTTNINNINITTAENSTTTTTTGTTTTGTTGTTVTTTNMTEKTPTTEPTTTTTKKGPKSKSIPKSKSKLLNPNDKRLKQNRINNSSSVKKKTKTNNKKTISYSSNKLKMKKKKKTEKETATFAATTTTTTTTASGNTTSSTSGNSTHMALTTCNNNNNNHDDNNDNTTNTKMIVNNNNNNNNFIQQQQQQPIDHNMYIRHKREFERMLIRLEKIDYYGFFINNNNNNSNNNNDNDNDNNDNDDIPDEYKEDHIYGVDKNYILLPTSDDESDDDDESDNDNDEDESDDDNDDDDDDDESDDDDDESDNEEDGKSPHNHNGSNTSTSNNNKRRKIITDNNTTNVIKRKRSKKMIIKQQQEEKNVQTKVQTVSQTQTVQVQVQPNASKPWTNDENYLFYIGYKKYGRSWSKIASLIKTRTIQAVTQHIKSTNYKNFLLTLPNKTNNTNTNNNNNTTNNIIITEEGNKNSSSSSNMNHNNSIFTTTTNNNNMISFSSSSSSKKRKLKKKKMMKKKKINTKKKKNIILIIRADLSIKYNSDLDTDNDTNDDDNDNDTNDNDSDLEQDISNRHNDNVVNDAAADDDNNESTCTRTTSNTEKKKKKRKRNKKKKKKNKKKERPTIHFPSTPPYNFKVVRRRMELGRYVLDVALKEEEEVNGWKQKLLKEKEEKEAEKEKEHHKQCNKPHHRHRYRHRRRPLHPKGVNWDVFRLDILGMCNAAIQRDPDGTSGGRGTLGDTAMRIRTELEKLYNRTGKRHMDEIGKANALHKYTAALHKITNNEAAMQGKWRTIPFPERKYERLQSNVVCAGLSTLDEKTAMDEFNTSLPDSFVGLAYMYDDIGQSEGWMKSVVVDTAISATTTMIGDDDGGDNNNDNSNSSNPEKMTNKKKKAESDKKKEKEKEQAERALKADAGVIRAQVQATMQCLLIGVQDRVMTDLGIVKNPELQSANWQVDEMAAAAAAASASAIPTRSPSPPLSSSSPLTSSSSSPELAEQPVWGLDCYTRRNIILCLEDDFGLDISLDFVQRWLLIAINACPVDKAHDLGYAARILEGLPLTDDDILSNMDVSGHSSVRSDFDWGTRSLLGKALLDKIKSSGPPWLAPAARQLRLAVSCMGSDFFRVHPKGHGSVVLRHDGIAANSLVTFYRGEVYPPWRWGEKTDAIETIQQEKGLRPNLPDFYNMALERPQIDPRGYGMLFVDASRKAGHGSSVSHSCDPTCEVRVCALDGKLCLALCTSRDIEQGEELTFDYHAVTESLNEYQAAICLCGYGKCRGSFLHFAAADCYQQVLNRNSPLAVRLSSLIKGSMKQVMSEEDDKVLSRHGFGTAAFGAVSFNHHKKDHQRNDDIDNIPIWLRTFVADTLRYIEYERRALPISLLCDHLTDKKYEEKKEISKTTDSKSNKVDSFSIDDDDDIDASDAEEVIIPKELRKAVPGSKPPPVFLFFAEQEKDFFSEVLAKQGMNDLKGLEIRRAQQKIAGESWRALSDEKQQYWRDRAYKHWEAHGGKEKARLEEERQRKIKALQEKPRKKEQPKKKKKKKFLTEEERTEDTSTSVSPSKIDKISFEAADAEGISAMEQRIQQLTQTLSRVGRVLYRHREHSFEKAPSTVQEQLTTSESLRKRIHSPIAIWKDENIVGWMWNNQDGVVRTLINFVKTAECVSPWIRRTILSIERKYKVLKSFYDPFIPSGLKVNMRDNEITPMQARSSLTAALLELREALLSGIDRMKDDIRHFKARRKKAKARLNAAPDQPSRETLDRERKKLESEEIKAHVSYVMCDLVDKVVQRHELSSSSPFSSDIFADGAETSAISSIISNVVNDMKEKVAFRFSKRGYSSKRRSNPRKSLEMPTASPWMKHFHHRWKLMAAADLLLMYARTSTFFTIRPYISFKSTPIEVYARELGNAVPKSIMDGGDNDTAAIKSKRPENTEKKLDINTDEIRSVVSTVVSGMIKDVEATLECEGGTSSEKIILNGKDQLVGPPSSNMKYSESSDDFADDISSFRIGARFDVLREGKDKFIPGEVVDTDFTSDVKRVKFHFLRMKTKFDEWVEIGNSRIKHLPASSWGSSERAVTTTAKVKGEALICEEKTPETCKPDDIITKVAVEYKGEYVLSQLLQWYNAGIGQKAGMPNSLGCATLPLMGGCLADMDSSDENEDGKASVTTYEKKIRPLLVDWFEDRNKRGNPWPEEIQGVFVKETTSTPEKTLAYDKIPLGSPVLDFLVSGDDANMREVLFALRQGDGENTANGSPSAIHRKNSLERRLQSSVDEGMPDQAVANWVQCDRPECGKWRRLPWHVDVDALPDTFYCQDNIWNPNANTCDAPEDGWNEMSSPLVGAKAHDMDRDGGTNKNSEVKVPEKQKVGPFPTKPTNVKPIQKQSDGGKAVRCGNCKNCNRDNCGTCIYCLDKPKYGGPNKLKKGCVKRRCITHYSPTTNASERGNGSDTQTILMKSHNIDKDALEAALGMLQHQKEAFISPKNLSLFSPTPKATTTNAVTAISGASTDVSGVRENLSQHLEGSN